MNCTLHDWEDPNINEKKIIFVGTLFGNTLNYLSRFQGRDIIFYATLEGEPIIDTIAARIAKDMTLIACSNFVKEMVLRGGLKCEGVVYHGINMHDDTADSKFTDFLRAIENPRGEPARRRYKYLTVSGNMERKGLDRLIIAHRLVEFTRGNTILILHTGGGYVDVRGIAESLQITPERFWMTNTFGLLNKYQMNSLYQHADFIVQPSLTEGFGLPMIEAFRQRKPVIALDAPPYNEIVENGKTGILLPETGMKRVLFLNSIWLLMRLYNIQDLAKAIISLLDDDVRHDMSHNITQTVQDKFDSEKTYPQLLKYF